MLNQCLCASQSACVRLLGITYLTGHVFLDSVRCRHAVHGQLSTRDRSGCVRHPNTRVRAARPGRFHWVRYRNIINSSSLKNFTQDNLPTVQYGMPVRYYVQVMPYPEALHTCAKCQ